MLPWNSGEDLFVRRPERSVGVGETYGEKGISGSENRCELGVGKRVIRKLALLNHD